MHVSRQKRKVIAGNIRETPSDREREVFAGAVSAFTAKRGAVSFLHLAEREGGGRGLPLSSRDRRLGEKKKAKQRAPMMGSLLLTCGPKREKSDYAQHSSVFAVRKKRGDHRRKDDEIKQKKELTHVKAHRFALQCIGSGKRERYRRSQLAAGRAEERKRKERSLRLNYRAAPKQREKKTVEKVMNRGRAHACSISCLSSLMRKKKGSTYYYFARQRGKKEEKGTKEKGVELGKGGS